MYQYIIKIKIRNNENRPKGYSFSIKIGVIISTIYKSWCYKNKN